MTNYSYFPKCGGQIHLRAASQPIAGARMARRKIKRSRRSVRGNHDIYRSVNGIGLKQYRQVGSRGKERVLNSKAGIWLDHRKAVIVFSGAAGERTLHVLSNAEKHLQRAGDSPLKGPYEARQVPADDKRQRALTGELNRYYDAIIAAVGSAQLLLIFGPGEAKLELKRRAENKGIGARIVAVEPADKLTDQQIDAKVCSFFSAS
jgi:hypothetical protein